MQHCYHVHLFCVVWANRGSVLFILCIYTCTHIISRMLWGLSIASYPDCCVLSVGLTPLHSTNMWSKHCLFLRCNKVDYVELTIRKPSFPYSLIRFSGTAPHHSKMSYHGAMTGLHSNTHGLPVLACSPDSVLCFLLSPGVWRCRHCALSGPNGGLHCCQRPQQSLGCHQPHHHPSHLEGEEDHWW